MITASRRKGEGDPLFVWRLILPTDVPTSGRTEGNTRSCALARKRFFFRGVCAQYMRGVSRDKVLIPYACTVFMYIRFFGFISIPKVSMQYVENTC